MKSSFTLNELILSVCGEKGGAGNRGDVVACETGCECSSPHEKLSNNNMLNSGFSISPNKRIIDNILNYSRALSIVNTENSGNFSLMMN